jgi:cobalt-zinc-cadmium efflux system protein
MSQSHCEHVGNHAHAPADFGRAFALGILLNLVFVAAEAGFGLASGSMALLADAGHNLSDVLGLVIAWGGAVLARRPPTPRFTYGMRSSSILAALANSLLLLMAIGAISLEAIGRLGDPQLVAGKTVIIVAGIGIMVNGATALLFASGRKSDVNIRGAFLHMAGDAIVSAGVVIAGLIMLLTGAMWIDPVISLIIVALIFWSTWGLFKEAIAMLLGAVPRGIDVEEVRRELLGLAGVSKVHDLHIWPMSTSEVALTAHLVTPAGHPGDAFLAELQDRLARRFGIEHCTIQIEIEDFDMCRLAPDHAV